MITRDEFINMLVKFDKSELIVRKFEETFNVSETESYVFIRYESDVTIIEKASLDKCPKIINWYKLYHFGRALNLNGFSNQKEIQEFISEVVSELKGEYGDD